MENGQIHLRIKQVVERAQVIEESLNEISELSDDRSVQKSKNFVLPNEIVGLEKHWKNFCVSSRRRLYGLNQKITTVKRVQQSIEVMDIELLRLISQASLDSSQLLRGLLQFPEKLQSKSEQKNSSDIITKIVTASKHLLLILQQFGFTSGGMGTVQGDGDDSFSTSIEEVESSVVELLERGAVSQHLARMAKLRLDSGKAWGGNRAERTAPDAKSVLLPCGRRMFLVRDSLSHLISRQKHAGRASKGTARSSSAGVLSMPSKVRHSRPTASRRRRHRSLSERRSGRPQRRRREGRDQDEETKRHQLWQELLPLLLNQVMSCAIPY
ncbi:hypothetical protein FHG87_011383 [Trinorchestia longiramus]|nr:hypothetical protein FHG87_011383 [Trinorchestia longiramus]